jgi:hypothetical protein
MCRPIQYDKAPFDWNRQNYGWYGLFYDRPLARLGQTEITRENELFLDSKEFAG